MVQVRNVLRALAHEHVRPDLVLATANDVLHQFQVPKRPFVTCCYATLDTNAGRLTWARAGHFDPLLVQGRAAYTETRGGPPLAAIADTTYPVSTAELDPGDRLLFFTDGLVERRDRSLDEGLHELVARCDELRTRSAEECVDGLAAAVEQQVDDLAILCVDLLSRPRPAAAG
jgi:serine phosphatase RsbU (regulator of sigma subunit)